jgi:hypothetical protein
MIRFTASFTGLRAFVTAFLLPAPRVLFPLTCWTVLLTIATRTLTADDDATRERRHRQHLDRRTEILETLQNDLSTVAVWCEERSLNVAAGEVRALAADLAGTQPVTDRGPSQLPDFVTPEIPATLSADEQEWRIRVREYRQTHAKELYSLARAALRAGFPSLAFSMAGDVLRIDPDHRYARAVIGHEKFVDPLLKDNPGYAGEWVTAFEKSMRRGSRPHTHHPQFGWIPTASVERYEQGFRPWKGDWITEVKEAELRRNFSNAWEIPSEHFLIRTNAGLEKGVALAADLETFHAWLTTTLAAFFETPDELQQRFEEASDRAARKPDKPMIIHFYASRDEYNAVVRDKVPAGVQTNGLYWQPDRIAYFFDSTELEDRATHYHEATHQILHCAAWDALEQAARLRARRNGQKSAASWVLCERSNAWILEGLACYFESFEIVEGQVRVGRPDYQRFLVASERIVNPANQYYLPSRDLMALGAVELQNHPQIARLYTQSAGFVHFLMHYEDGRYRDDLITLLNRVYRPNLKRLDDEPSLAKITGVSTEELDRQYFLHMQDVADWIALRQPAEEEPASAGR